MATYQSALTPILNFFLSSEVATTWQTDGAVYKLKPRLFYKFAHLWVHLVDFYPGVNHTWQSASWNIPWPISFEILKGPYLFWSSFFKDLFEWMFLASHHILSSSFSLCRFCLFLLNYFFMTSCADSINFVASSQLYCNLVRNSFNFGNSIYTVNLPSYKYHPKLSTNSICLVTICFLSLYWNSVATIHSVQSSCR